MLPVPFALMVTLPPDTKLPLIVMLPLFAVVVTVALPPAVTVPLVVMLPPAVIVMLPSVVTLVLVLPGVMGMPTFTAPLTGVLVPKEPVNAPLKTVIELPTVGMA